MNQESEIPTPGPWTEEEIRAVLGNYSPHLPYSMAGTPEELMEFFGPPQKSSPQPPKGPSNSTS